MPWCSAQCYRLLVFSHAKFQCGFSHTKFQCGPLRHDGLWHFSLREDVLSFVDLNMLLQMLLCSVKWFALGRFMKLSALSTATCSAVSSERLNRSVIDLESIFSPLSLSPSWVSGGPSMEIATLPLQASWSSAILCRNVEFSIRNSGMAGFEAGIMCIGQSHCWLKPVLNCRWCVAGLPNNDADILLQGCSCKPFPVLRSCLLGKTLYCLRLLCKNACSIQPSCEICEHRHSSSGITQGYLTICSEPLTLDW